MEAIKSNNIYYANGRIALLSNKLFAKDKYNRLIEAAGLNDAIKILHEAHYGRTTQAHDTETLFQNELMVTVDLLKELCQNKNAAYFFLCVYDYHNAKVLMKCKYGRLDGLELCFRCGNYSPEEMKEAINSDCYTNLPSFMANALHKIDDEFANGNRSPRLIDITLDKSMYAEMQGSAKRSGLKALKTYMTFTIDATNLLLLFRYKKNNLDKACYERELVDGGRLKKSFLLELIDMDMSSISSAFYLNEYSSFIKICIDGLEGNSLLDAQQYISLRKSTILSENQNQDTVMPVLAYFAAKTDEIDKIRFIMMCIKQGMSKETIKDRVGRLYA